MSNVILSFNRTLVELKLIIEGNGNTLSMAFNRTLVELKHRHKRSEHRLSKLLIVP